MKFETCLFEIDGAVATITMNRPEAANALDLQMAKDLFYASIECDENPEIRAVVLTGAGKLFSGGGDLGFFAKQDNIQKTLKEMTGFLHAGISRLVRMNAPLIAAINGTAGGAGFSLVCMADMAIMADSAKLTLAYTGAGLTPDGSSTYFLPRIVGLRRAIELAVTNRRLTAEEALEWGLVNQVVPKEDVLSTATDLAKKLAQGPTIAYGKAAQLMRESLENSFETQMEFEAQTIVNVTRSEDTQEGISAFLEKRRPVFNGR